MELTPFWPDYAAFPHRFTLGHIGVPGSNSPSIPYMEWLYETMLIRAWCEENLQGPWVFITSNEPRILTQLEEDHTLVELTWA